MYCNVVRKSVILLPNRLENTQKVENLLFGFGENTYTLSFSKNMFAGVRSFNAFRN